MFRVCSAVDQRVQAIQQTQPEPLAICSLFVKDSHFSQLDPQLLAQLSLLFVEHSATQVPEC